MASRESRSTSVGTSLLAPFLFLLPALLLLDFLRYAPALSAFYHSLTEWDGVGTGLYVGLDQYRTLFEDKVFLLSLQNIIKYGGARTFIIVAMSFLGAELVYNLSSRREQSFWRIVFTIPMLVPQTVELLIWGQVFAARRGLLSEFLKSLGIIKRVHPWLGDPNTALWALVLVGFPLITGIGFLVLLAALRNLPAEVNDAALIDGCSRLRRVFSIDLPNIRGPLALVAIINLNATLQAFGPMYIMTSGGPVNTTMSPVLFLYQQAFQRANMGYATAAGVVLLFLTLGLSVVILRTRYKGAHDVSV